LTDALREAVVRASVVGDDPRLAVERVLRAHRVLLRAPRIDRTPDGRAFRWDTPHGPVTLYLSPDAAPAVVVGSPLTHSEVSHMRHSMNPERFRQLQSEVAEKASEKAQVNAVVAALSAMGHRNAASPEVSQTSVDRSTYRIYLWRETPFGDHVVLATGPSFEPSLLLAKSIPATPNTPGFYVHALIAEGDVKPLSGAKRTAERFSEDRTAAIKATADAKAAKAKAEAKAAKEKAAMEEERRKDAERREAEERARRAEAERRAAEERAEKERAKREAAEKKAAKPVAAKPAKKAEDKEAKLTAMLASLLG
jgi:hypothetical protein